jgi:iron complex transport system permease protein
VLGISGGASVGALGVLWLGSAAGVAALPEWGVAAGAAVGALLAAAVLFALSWRVLGGSGVAATQESSVALLLVGVMIGTACSAFVSMLLVLASEAQLRGMVFWLLGDLNGATRWGTGLLASAVALALVWPSAHELDWLARGDAWAATLGVPVVRRRRIALAAAALATGAAVASAGAIGFVGLVVPHALRLAGARAAPLLLPASALGGGAFVVLADAVARTIVAPVQLPVGVLAAAVGVPAFLALLLHRPSGGRR